MCRLFPRINLGQESIRGLIKNSLSAVVAFKGPMIQVDSSEAFSSKSSCCCSVLEALPRGSSTPGVAAQVPEPHHAAMAELQQDEHKHTWKL